MIWLSFALAASAFAPKPFAVQLLQEVSGRQVTICLDGRTVETTFAGKLAFRDDRHSWMSVCADVRSPVRAGQVFGMVARDSAKVGGGITKAGNIVARCFADAQTPDQCAGLQLAVWKAIEDNADVPNFAVGRFQARASMSVLMWAQQYYAAAGTPGSAVYLMAAAGGFGGGGGQGGAAGGVGGQAAGAQGGGGGGQSQLSGG